jgi:hypothetical protein
VTPRRPPWVDRVTGASDWLGHAFTRDLDRDYRAHGVDAIEKLRKNEPMNYFRLLLSLVPRELPTGDDFLKLLTDEELDALIKYLREATQQQQTEAPLSPLGG